MPPQSSFKKPSTNLVSYGNITVGQKIVYSIMSKIRPSRADTILANYAVRFESLRQEINEMGYFCKGTVLKRMMKCGQERCACHRDPAKRHGPYFEWTYKTKGKTINIRLAPDEVPVYEAATQQYRKLRSLLTRMERLSRTALAWVAKKAASGSSGP